MGKMKEELKKLRDKLLQNGGINLNPMGNVNKNQLGMDMMPLISLEMDDLNKKVDNFIDWYSSRMLNDGYVYEYKEYFTGYLRNFIEKMAVWYELRYPDYDVWNLINDGKSKECGASITMFKENPYIRDILDDSSEVKYLDWDEFYNAKAFINSLPDEEKDYLSKPKYMDFVHFDPIGWGGGLELSAKGIVLDSCGVKEHTDSKVSDKELIGMHIKDVLSLFKERGIELSEKNQLELAVKEYEEDVYFKEELLNCVMYRIIERGDIRMGPRRAFLFAKEFDRCIDVPMMYGVDFSDRNLLKFVGEYLKSGGSEELLCYAGYFYKKVKENAIKIVSVKEVIEKLKGFNNRYDESNSKTQEAEETSILAAELHQRLVNCLASQVDYDVVEEEQVKRQRLERKLQKSRSACK